MDAGGDRGDRRVHVPVVRPLLVVEHDRDDEHDDIRLARRGGAVGRGPETTGGMGRADELGQARLLGDVALAGVDRVHDACCTSTAMTDQPWLAYCAHRGRPILPAPITATVPAVPGSPVHGVTIGCVGRGGRRSR